MWLSDGVTRGDGLTRKCRLVFVYGHVAAIVSRYRIKQPVLIRCLIRLCETVAVFVRFGQTGCSKTTENERHCVVSPSPRLIFIRVVPNPPSLTRHQARAYPLPIKSAKKVYSKCLKKSLSW